jgi:hypothetical protein
MGHPAGGPPQSIEEIEYASLALLVPIWRKRCGSAVIRKINGRLYLEVGGAILLDPLEALAFLPDD